MQNAQPTTDYAKAISGLVRQLPGERAAQLYDFARFLLQESRSSAQPNAMEDDDNASEEEMVAEDALWEASITRHADRFAALKAQAKADVMAQRAVSMFNEQEEFSVE